MIQVGAGPASALLAWRTLPEEVVHAEQLCSLAHATDGAHGSTTGRTRAKGMKSRGFFGIAGEHTLKAHVFEADGKVVSLAQIEAHARKMDAVRSRDARKIPNLKALTAPYKHAGKEPSLDAHLAASAKHVWSFLRKDAPTLDRVQCTRVHASVRGIDPSVPATAASVYVARPRTSGNAPSADMPPRAQSVTLDALTRDDTAANKWHVDHLDGSLAIISNAGLDLKRRLRARLAGGQFACCLGATGRAHGCAVLFDAMLGAHAIQDWMDAAVRKTNSVARPATKRELRLAIIEGRALVVVIPAGCLILAETNKLWHCVLSLDSLLDAKLIRLAFILYVHSSVVRVAELLQQPGAQIARFDSVDAAYQWRIRNASALPPRLVHTSEFAYDWSTLVLAHPPATLNASSFDGMTYLALRVGSTSVRVAVLAMARWLAHEVVERTVCGTL